VSEGSGVVVNILTHCVTFYLSDRFDSHNFAPFYQNSYRMRLFLFATVLLASFTLSAKDQSASASVSVYGTETVASSQIDKKKQRRNKRMNKKRKKACANWSKRSYAG
jgi:hypothetical protein